jgi:uncharacterized membrane protein YgcG
MRSWRILPLIFSLLAFVLIPQPQYSFSAALEVPGNVTAFGSSNANFGNGTITVNWSEVSGATAYSVRATRSGTTDAVLASVAGQKNTKLVVSSLTGGAQYVVQVRTIKVDEVSAWSSDSLVITPLTKPKAPLKPSALPLTGGATVSWVLLTESENGGSPITSYVVTETKSAKSKSVGPNVESTSFADLTDGEKASFTVAAVTDVDRSGSVSVASDEITIGSAGEASPSPTATPTASASPSASASSTSGSGSSSGGGSSGGSSGGGGGGGGGAVKQTALYFKIVDPSDSTKMWDKRGCVSIYSRDLSPQFMGSGCADESGNINVLAGDAKVVVRVYEFGYGDKFRSYFGEIANDVFTLDAKFFPGTTRYAVSIAIDIPVATPTPTPTPTPTSLPSPTPTPTPTPSPSPTPTPTPSVTLSTSPTPSAIPTPSPSKSPLIPSNSYIAIGTKTKSLAVTVKKSAYVLKVGTQAKLTWSGLTRSSTVQLSIKTPAKKTYKLPTSKIKATSYTTPKLLFKKKGTYSLVVKYGKKSKTLTISIR